jgi:hypothetical protein
MESKGSQVLGIPEQYNIDLDLLRALEICLQSGRPGICQVPYYVRSIGRTSTSFEINLDSMSGILFNRISIFDSSQEVDHFKSSHGNYLQILEKQVGMQLRVLKQATIKCPTGTPVFYIIQCKFPAYSIGNNAIHLMNRLDTIKFFSRVLNELRKVWRFNREHPNNEVSIDGRLINWALDKFDPDRSLHEQDINLVYLNTSKPFFRIAGIEQLEPSIILRTTPGIIARYIMRFTHDKFVAPFYDQRSMILDLLSGFYEENRPDLVAELLFAANYALTREGNTAFELQPIQDSEIRRRYWQQNLVRSMISKQRRIECMYYRKLLRRAHPHFPFTEIS